MIHVSQTNNTEHIAFTNMDLLPLTVIMHIIFYLLL